ncbi:MAG: ABC transporter permease [Woeseiaceae bacterium]
MTAYYIRLAWLSIRKNPLLTSLMIGAIALGIGVSMTTLTLYYVMSSNPIPSKSEQLFAVQVDSWSPDDPYSNEDGGSPPTMLTYRDAIALMETEIPTHQATMMHRGFVMKKNEEGARVEHASARATYGDFFPMFNVPFKYGAGWDEKADKNAERVVVLSSRVNDKLYGGENSVGETLVLDGEPFRISGVLEPWRPSPVFYDLDYAGFTETEDIWVPFQVPISLEYGPHGNTNCWKPEEINSFQDFLQSECVWIQHWAQLDTVAQQQEYLAFLDAYVNEQKRLGRFERPLDNRIQNVMAWMDFRNVVSADNTLLVVLSLMFLMICLLNTVGLMLAKFINRAPLVGVRRALGASRMDVIRQHGIEVMFIGALGGIAGLGLSYLGLLAVRNWYRNYEYLARLDPVMVFSAVGLAIAAALIAGLYPTWRISRIQPAVHLKAQ